MSTTTPRHEINPFLVGMDVTVGSSQVRISTLGKDDNIMINQSTGEVTGTHIVARKKIDKTKFVKTFADYISFTFDLTKAGNKALRVVMWAIKENAIGKDQVVLDKYTHEAFMSHHSDQEPPLVLSKPTFGRGLGELEKAKIIAKAKRIGTYFINPNCIFNGDRVAFTTILENSNSDDTQSQGSLI